MHPERDAAPGRFTDIARRADPDRFLTVLTAPAGLREPLCVLIALNHALVRATELSSSRSGAGPIAGLIRLQWWRDIIERSRTDGDRDALAIAVRALLDRRAVRPETLLALVGAREAEMEGLATVAAWRESLLEGAGSLQRAIGEILGVPPSQSGRLAAVGAAYACGALRRYLPALLATGRPLLPGELGDALPLAARRAFLAEQGASFLGLCAGPPLPRRQRCALLPLVLARRDLRTDPARLDRSGGERGLGDRLAVLATSVRR